MNEFKKTPERVDIQAKATEISLFLKEHLNNKMPSVVSALFEQIGIKEGSVESEMLASATDPENYIAKSGTDRQKIDDMVQSLRSAIEGESGEM